MPVVNVNGTTLYYEDHGPKEAPAIVFSHSLFFTTKMFQHQVEEFSKSYRVICYDHRGQGQSARDVSENLDMDTLTEDAASLIEALDLKRCHFVGNSMGGFIALRLAARRPDLLLSCAVLGSSGEEEFKKADFQPVVEHLQQHGGKPLIDTLLYIMFGDQSLESTAFAEERNYWKDYMENLDNSIGDCAYQVVHRNSVLPELTGVDVPVLAIAGSEDHAYTVPLSENIARVVNHGVCHTIEGAGHSVALEKPEEANTLLAEHFLLAAKISS